MSKTQVTNKLLALVLVTFLAGTALADEKNGILDTAKIEQLTGLKGTFNKDENVFKVASPRNDIKKFQ